MGNLKSRLQDPEYENWVKAGLCLIALKTGLESFAESKSKEFHQAVLDHLAKTNVAVAVNCMCPNSDVKFKGNNSYATCQHTFCNSFLNAIIHVGVDPSLPFTFRTSNLANTNPQLWHCAPWELAKLFMNPGQKVTQTGPAETDISGVINFLDHCTVARAGILNIQNITEVRNARNIIMHSAELKISNSEFQALIQSMIDLIEDPKTLAGLHDAQDASKQIKEIVSSNFIISLEDESKVLNDLGSEVRTISENLQTEIQDLRKQQHDGQQSHADGIMGLSRYFKEQMSKMETSIKVLENRIAKDKALRIAMKSNLSELQRLTEQTKHDYQILHTEIGNLRQQMSGYERRTHSLETAQTSLEARVSAITTREVTESDCLQLRDFLLNTYKSVYNEVPLSPIYEGPNDDVLKVPVREIYTDVQILQYDRRGKGKKTELKSYKDLFCHQDKKNKHIFVTGEAGAGKSTWCLNLINRWCEAQKKTEGQSFEQFNSSDITCNKDLIDAVSAFRYLFFGQLRYLKSKSTIEDCIFSPILEKRTNYKAIVRHILQNYSETVLILLDGYDEYRGSLSFQGLNESTVIITTRPWKLVAFSSETSSPKIDVELTLNGLNRTGVEVMIDKAMKIFKDEEDDAERENERIKCLLDIRSAGLSESVKIPLILLIVILTWLKNNSTLSLSLTRNLLGMLEVIFSRGEEKVSERVLPMLKVRNSKSVIAKKILEYPILSRYQRLMLELGQLAFSGLCDTDKPTALVFTQKEVVNFVHPEDLDTCFKFGLLSSATVCHSLLEKKKMYISFYHKLIQEFFAALWIVSDKKAFRAAKTRFSRKEDVLECNKVMLFVSGLDPSVGSLLTRQLDTSSQKCHSEISYSERLSEMILNCMTEMSSSGESEHPLFISEIVLDCYDVTIVESLIKLIGYNKKYLQTLRVKMNDEIPTACISLLAKSLQNTKCLKSLHIRCGVMTGNLWFLSLPNLPLKQIEDSKIMSDCVSINSCPRLEEIYLEKVQCKSIKIYQLPQLNTLSLARIEATESINLETLPSLKELSMQNVNCTYFQIQALPNLTKLNLWHIEIYEGVGLENLSEYGEPSSTENIKCKRICVNSVSSLNKLDLLREQRANLQNQIKLLGIEHLTLSTIECTDLSFRTFPYLTTLRLEHVSNIDVTALVKKCQVLKALILYDITASSCRLAESDSIEKLSARYLKLRVLELESMPNLTQLQLRDIKAAESIYIENCPGLTRSEEIVIANVACKFMRVQSVTILKKMGMLKNSDTDSVPQSTHLWLVSLTLLTVSGSDIKFETFPNLTELRIENTSISLNDLLKQCPKLKDLTLWDISSESCCLEERRRLERFSARNLKVRDLKLVIIINLTQLQLKNIQAAESILIEYCPNLYEHRDISIETVECKQLQLNALHQLKHLSLLQINATDHLDLGNCSSLELITLSDIRAKDITFGSLENLTELTLENVIYKDLDGVVNNCLALRILKLTDVTVENFSLERMHSLEMLTALHLKLKALKLVSMQNLTYIQLNDIKAAESIQVECCPKLIKYNKSIKNVECKHLKYCAVHSLKYIRLFQINATDTIELDNCSSVEQMMLSDITAKVVTIGLFENLTALHLDHASHINFNGLVNNFPRLKALSLFDVTSENICIEESSSLEIVSAIRLKLINLKLVQIPNLIKLELKDVEAAESVEIGNCVNLVEHDISIETMECKQFKLHSLHGLKHLKLFQVNATDHLDLGTNSRLKPLTLSDITAKDITLGSLEHLTELTLENVSHINLNGLVNDCFALKVLNLIGVTLENISLEGMHSLKCIKMFQIDVTDTIALDNCSCVEQMVLSDITAKVVTIELFENLTDLHLDHASHINFSGLVENCPRLKELSLFDLTSDKICIKESNSLEMFSAKRLKLKSLKLVQIPNLIKLELKAVAAAESIKIDNCQSLIKHNNISIETMECKQFKLNSLHHLKHLMLFQIHASERLDIGNCSSLERLILSDIKAKDVTFGSFKRLIELTLENVMHVHLTGFALSCLALKVLNLTDVTCETFSLEGMQSLEKLTALHLKLKALKHVLMPNLTYTRLDDITVSETIQVETCPKLVNIGKNSIQNLKCKHLEIRAVHSLKYIRLFQINATDTIELDNCSSVEQMMLSGITAKVVTIGLFEHLTDLHIDHASHIHFNGLVENCPRLKALTLVDVTSDNICIEESSSLEMVSAIRLKLINLKLTQIPNLTEVKVKEVAAESIEIGNCQNLNEHNNISIENLKCKRLNIQSVPYAKRLSLWNINVTESLRLENWFCLEKLAVFNIQWNNISFGTFQSLNVVRLQETSKINLTSLTECCPRIKDLSLVAVKSDTLHLEKCNSLIKFSALSLKLIDFKLLSLVNLTELYLKDIDIDESFHIEDCPNLSRLDDISIVNVKCKQLKVKSLLNQEITSLISVRVNIPAHDDTQD